MGIAGATVDGAGVLLAGVAGAFGWCFIHGTWGMDFCQKLTRIV